MDRDYHVRILAKRLRRIEKDMKNQTFGTKGRTGFGMANVLKNWNSCSVKIIENFCKYGHKLGISEEEALKNSFETKSKKSFAVRFAPRHETDMIPATKQIDATD